MRLHTKSIETVATCTPVVSGLADEPDLQSFDPGYLPYVSRGFVSFSRIQLPWTLILESAWPFSTDSDTGVYAKGIHKLCLSSNFKLQEEVSLGVTHFLHLRLSQCPLPLPSHQFIQHV